MPFRNRATVGVAIREALMKTRLLFAASALAAAFSGHAAFAQEAPPPDQGGVDEITVTAQRRAESVQDVPIAITAFSPAQLEAAQIGDTVDLVRFTPGLTGGLNTGTGGAVSYFMRGIGSTEQVATFDAPVATYVDEIYIARQSVNNLQLFDVERVEVLRGPQGTLFGRNTTGGAISIVNRKPSEDPDFFAEASYGSYNRGLLRATIDIPISDRVLTKFSAFAVKDDGYGSSLTTGEDLSGEDSIGLRAAVRLLPTETITWDLAIDHTNQEKTTIGVNPIDQREHVSRTGLRRGDCDDGSINDYLFNRVGNCSRIVSTGLSSNFEVDTDFATISFITGYRVIDQDFYIDFGLGGNASQFGGFGIGNEITNQQFTQEVKLVGDAGRFRWVGGAFYLKEDNKTWALDSFATTPTATSALILGEKILYNTAESYAVYAQGDLDVTDWLMLTLGGRYTQEEKTIAFRDAVRGSYPTGFVNAAASLANRPTTQNLINFGIPTSQDVDKFTPRAVVTLKPSDDFILYASATNGFKSGGWNARDNSAALNSAFGPEEAWSYELGAKTDWFNNRLRLNATYYHLEVDDLQLISGGVNPATGAIAFITRNSGKLEADGIELEVVAAPTDAFDIFGSISVADRSYTDIPVRNGTGNVPCSSTPEPGQCVTERDDPVRFPELQGNLGAAYTIPLEGIGDLVFSGSASYSQTYWTSTFNDTPTATGVPTGGTTPVTVRLSKVPVTTVFNVAASFTSADDKWNAALECSNCGDEYYLTSSLVGLGYANEPRRVTFRIRYSY
jgi:iron complex outermembrane receptor protein